MKEKAFVLMLDTDGERSRARIDAISRSGHACRLVGSVKEAISSIAHRTPDVVVTRFSIDGVPVGEKLIEAAKRHAPDVEFIVLADDDEELLKTDVLSSENPNRAFDYMIGDVNVDALRRKVEGAAQKAIFARQKRLLREGLAKAYDFEGLIGTSETLRRELRRVSKLAPTKSTVLIVGETGTGKELVAAAIHRLSPRNAKPFKPINCAALSESLLESELFGHVKGAFTGAHADRSGLLEAADGGTLFLDEIGDMPLNMQAKLLRVLENGEFFRVGSTDLRNVDLRFVAATHRDLRELLEQNKFREDLFYRLHGQSPIRIPPLRQRLDDIPLLVEHFLTEANAEHDRDIVGVSPEALRKLTNHSWRGNVRELKSVIECMVIESEGARLETDDLPDHIRGSTDIVTMSPSMAGLSMADVEKIHILNTLKLTGGNREKAASILKIGARTLYRKLKDFGIT